MSFPIMHAHRGLMGLWGASAGIVLDSQSR